MNWLSGDRPGGRALAILLIVIVLGLWLAPWFGHSTRSLNVAAKIAIFIVLAASFDLLLGYTGIVSFAHTMFFGIGAYGLAIAATRYPESGVAMILGVAGALAVSAVLSLIIGLFSLRVRALFFAMITLAVASAFLTLASQLSDLTGGEDGLNFSVPSLLSSGTEFGRFAGLDVTGKTVSYYVILISGTVLFLAMLRIVNSPFGRVLQAIRENEFRAEAIGYRTVVYRTLLSVIAALFATLAGALLALWLHYNGPDTSLSFELMVDLLLMVVIGGMGTLYGAIVGATVLILAQSYLQDLMQSASTAVSAVPHLAVLAPLISSDRWLLWLGVLFVASVYFFPEGIVGRLRNTRS